MLKEDTDFDKLIRVYEAMVNIGKEAHQAKAKGSEAVMKQLKSLTMSHVPSGD